MKRLFIALAALCVLVLSVAGIALLTRSQQQQAAERREIAAGPASLARELAAARREGVPLTAQELQPPLPPAGQNAAPLYTKLTTLLYDKPLGLPKYAEGMDAFHAYTPAQIAAVRQTLAARQDVMTLVHQAADKPRCVFVRDWNQGVQLNFPEFMPMREAARLIKTESYLLARDGRCKEAVADQARGFRVAQHAASDHVLLAYLVGIACESLTLNGMQSILAVAGPKAATDAEVQQAVAAEQSRLSLRDAMAGEAGFDCTVFRAMHQAESQGIDAVIAAAGFSGDAAHNVRASAGETQHLHNLIDAWQAEYLARMMPLVTASNQPPSVRRTVYASKEAQAERDSSRPDVLTLLFADDLIPVFTKIDQNDTRTQARVAVTLAAAAVLAAKAKTGAFPAALPPSFLDPFTGRPLGYNREGANGFVVYSAGPTGEFDGGKPSEKAPGQESVFRYPAIAVPLTPDMLN